MVEVENNLHMSNEVSLILGGIRPVTRKLLFEGILRLSCNLVRDRLEIDLVEVIKFVGKNVERPTSIPSLPARDRRV